MKHAQAYVAISILAGWAAPAAAGIADNVQFGLHRKDPTTKTATICTTYSPNANNLNCWEYITHGPAPGESLIYMVAAFGPPIGINGVSFGIDYEGRAGEASGIDPDYNFFHFCADGLPFANDGGFGEFPAPKGGLRATWVTCQTQVIGGFGVHAVIGALDVYAYSEDVLKITPNNNLDSGPELAVATCDGAETDLLDLYPPSLWYTIVSQVQLGGDGSQGYACIDLATRESTWGRIKTLYSGR